MQILRMSLHFVVPTQLYSYPADKSTGLAWQLHGGHHTLVLIWVPGHVTNKVHVIMCLSKVGGQMCDS